MDAASPTIVIEQPAQKYDVREVAVEQIARLLCRADGIDPDADWRIQGSTMLTVADPTPQMWRRYRDKAVAALEAAFVKH
jgi:hypothetical protein